MAKASLSSWVRSRPGGLIVVAGSVLVLRFYEGLTEAEVARLLRLPLGTVKSLAHRGLARLRATLGAAATGNPRGGMS